MDFGRDDLARFIYTLGVAVSGVYIERSLQPPNRFVAIGLAAVIAVGFTIYYRWSVLPRLTQEGRDIDREPDL